jgi:hypothetical protein
MGTGEKGRGIEMNVPAAIRAAKRAVRVILRICLLLPETEALLLLLIMIPFMNLSRKRACPSIPVEFQDKLM